MTAADQPHGDFASQARSAFMNDGAHGMTDREERVIWNGSLGLLVMAALGQIERSEDGRSACLAPPYDIVGPFSLDELETRGRIAFGECLVMSRQRWQQDQVDLRIKAYDKRRALFVSMQPNLDDDSEQRGALDLPMDGALTRSEIKAAFRMLAKTAHPDAGGSSDHYRRIAEARDALLEKVAGSSRSSW